jgi:phage protein D
MGLPIDYLEAIMKSSKYKFEKQDVVNLKLGYDGKLIQTFHGFIDDVEAGISKVRLIAMGSSKCLVDIRINKLYQDQTAGDIVNDLLSEAKLEKEEIQDGISFPNYVVDERHNGYEHIIKLGERCGFDVYITEEGKLMFRKFDSKKKFTMVYGVDILAIEFKKKAKLLESSTVFGESPASSQGAETYHWWAKEELKATTGDGAARVVCDPTIKTRENAKRVSKALQEQLKYNQYLSVFTLGKPEIQLGHTLVIEGLSYEQMNNEYEIIGLGHQMSKTMGFTSRFDCRRSEKS